VPAVIVHGNTLTFEEWSHWYSPAHIIGGWEWRLRRRDAEDGAHEIIAPLPLPGVLRLQPAKPLQLTLF
jgi:hypothetical protein